MQLGAREAVERLALGGRGPQPLLVGLAVHDDELAAELGEHADRRTAAADDGAAAPLGRHRAAEQQLAGLDLAAGLGDALGDGAVVGHEPAPLDPRLLRAGTHGARRRRARRAAGRAP